MGLWETSSPSKAPVWATLPFLPKSSLSHGSRLSSLNNQMTPQALKIHKDVCIFFVCQILYL